MKCTHEGYFSDILFFGTYVISPDIICIFQQKCCTESMHLHWMTISSVLTTSICIVLYVNNVTDAYMIDILDILDTHTEKEK